MSKAGKITAAISGAFLLLIVVAIILIATFDWNRLKPTINQKVSAELNRPFAIRGDLGVVWERQKQETGWRSWVRGPVYTRKTSFLAIHRIFPKSRWCICHA
ncbi:AsmA family protein [Escherichia coli]